MIDLCISSSVTVKSMSLTSKELSEIIDSELFFLNDDQIENKVDSRFLKEIENSVDEKIKFLMENLEESVGVGIVYTTIFYKETVLQIDYKRKSHFRIALMIGLNNLINRTIESDGVLYLFNRTILTCFRNADVLAIMKIKYSTTISEMEEEINNLTEEFVSVKKITRMEVEQSIQYLKSLGFVDNDVYDQNEYRLTGKGHMLVI